MCLVEDGDNYSSNNHLPEAAVVVGVLTVTFRIVSAASGCFECPAAASIAWGVASWRG